MLFNYQRFIRAPRSFDTTATLILRDVFVCCDFCCAFALLFLIKKSKITFSWLPNANSNYSISCVPPLPFFFSSLSPLMQILNIYTPVFRALNYKKEKKRRKTRCPFICLEIHARARRHVLHFSILLVRFLERERQRKSPTAVCGCGVLLVRFPLGAPPGHAGVLCART
jgi:hypothetical protein